MLDRGQRREALALLMQRHGAAVYRYCRTAVHDAAIAADIHQEVFMDAFRELPRFARRSTLRTWLLGVARHRVIDVGMRRRRAHAHIEADDTTVLLDSGMSASDALDDAQLRAALAAAIAQLDEPARTAVILRYERGLSYEEMSEILNEKPGTLQARVARSLRRLREMIDND